MKKIAVGLATVFALTGGSLALSPEASANEWGCDPNVPAVVISGGSVSNVTDINLTANAGTAIGDASGGDENDAFLAGGDGDEVAAAGNGGTSDSSANGGAIVTGNVNSGGNSGNTISVGDTVCAPAPAPAPEKPVEKPIEKPVEKPVVYEKPAAPAPKPVVGRPAAAPVVAALPDTGTGVAGEANFGFIALALVGAVVAAGYSVRARFN